MTRLFGKEHHVMMVSHKTLGHLVLGMILAAAVFGMAWKGFRVSKTAPKDSVSEETHKGESFSSTTDLDAILRSLPRVDENASDLTEVDWVSYTDGQDRFALQRPRDWEIADVTLPGRPQFRQIVVSQGVGALAIYPKGEFDIGLPSRSSVDTAIILGGQPATMREWHLPDGSWFAIVTLDAVPVNGFRIELSILQPDPIIRNVLQEMLNRFQFLVS